MGKHQEHHRLQRRKQSVSPKRTKTAEYTTLLQNNCQTSRGNFAIILVPQSTMKKWELKTQCSTILHDIANILNEDKNCELDNLALEIDKCRNDTTKMYQVVKFNDRKPLENLMTSDKAGRNVTEPNAVYNIIIYHFKSHFKDQRESNLEQFIGNPRPLDTPIIKDEEAKSIHKLRNKRAPGSWNILLNSMIA